MVIDLSDQVDYHHIALGQPPRLAIDLPKVDWTLGDDASKAVGLIKGFRFGRPSPGFPGSSSTSQPFEIDRIFELPPGGRGHRVVTDLIELPVDGAVNGAIAPAGSTGSQNAAMVVVRPPARKPSPPPEKRIIVIDPGHGGVDPGAIGSAMKIPEKNVALRTAGRCATGWRRPAATG